VEKGSITTYPFIEIVISYFLSIYRGINQEQSGCPTSRELLVSPWSARKNQRAADLGKLSAICVFMRFYAFL
jgi:hypothetical protein